MQCPVPGESRSNLATLPACPSPVETCTHMYQQHILALQRMWHYFIKIYIWSCRVCMFHVSGLGIHSPMLALAATREEGGRGMQDPEQVFQHLSHSGRRRGLCGKRQKKDQSPVKRSARLSQPCILPQRGSDNLLYIITCQKYKHNVSAWMCQLKPGRKMSLGHSQTPGSAWLQCLSHACTLQHTYFISVHLSVFVFI